MFNLTKNQRDHTCRKRTCLSPSFTHVMCHIKSWNCSEKIKFLVVPNGITLAEMHSVRFTGTAGAAGLHKKTKNGKADCFALLRWITKLKCVNSEVKSVLSHPKKGCLNWLHGTLSEPPWTLHSTRMDLWIDPSGTESCKHAIRLVTYNIYIWDYGDHQLRLICAQVRHHSPAGTFSRVPGRCLHWSPTPQDPGDPLHYY